MKNKLYDYDISPILLGDDRFNVVEKYKPKVLTQPVGDMHILYKDNERGAYFTQEEFDMLDITMKEFHEYTSANIDIQDIKIQPIADLIFERNEDITYNECIEQLENVPEMYIIRHNSGNGDRASALLSPKAMHDIIEKLGDGFVIIPSSIYEAIVVPSAVPLEHEEILNMITEANETLDIEDVLSTNYITYNKEDRTMVMTNDVVTQVGMDPMQKYYLDLQELNRATKNLSKENELMKEWKNKLLQEKEMLLTKTR